MQIIIADSFEHKFFQKFCDLPFECSSHLTSLREDTQQMKHFLQDSGFANEYQWRAYLLVFNNIPQARVLISHKQKSKIVNVGYFEARSSNLNLSTLWQEVETQAKLWDANILKIPIQGHFWNSYRLSTGSHPALYGERHYPYFYPQLWEKSGFKIEKKWMSLRTQLAPAYAHYLKLKSRLPKDSHLNQVVYRTLEVNHWERDLKLFFDLLSTSYKNMSEFESISWPHFFDLVKDLKYILDPELCQFAFYQNHPVGFFMAMRCPQKSLLFVQNLRRRLKFLPVPRIVYSIIGVIHFKLFPGEFLIPYVGKIQGANLPPLHGIILEMSIRMCHLAFARGLKEVFPILLAENSPALKAIPMAQRHVHSEHFLWSKHLT